MRTQSLTASSMVKSSLIPLALAIGLLATFSASAADPVYKWTDGSGHSHYSQSPPEGMKYETITPAGTKTTTTAATSDSAAAVVPEEKAGPTTAQTERQKYCDQARKNADLLSTRPIVDMDINGDGKPERLTPEQQNSQLANAKQQVSMLCVK